MISFDDVTVEFGDTAILTDVSVTVPDGQFLALIGPNGAGKTTLLRTCNGYLTPTTGTVRIDSDDVASLSARAVGKRVATVPQGTTLTFGFDVRDVVAMGRTPHRSRFVPANIADKRAVSAALERTDTARFADRSIDELSGGERQRVLLARALAQETPVLLLDEPTASLDINHQIQTLSLARDLVDEGKTVVAAIHDLELAARFCDAVALLSDGRLVAHGPPEEVLTGDRLETAFEVRTAVATNPITGTRTVTPLSDSPPSGRRVHVVGNGDRAARVLGRLVEAGIEVTIGVVPEGDVALTTAHSIAHDFVAATPFEPISDEQREAAAELATRADVTVVVGDLDETNAKLVSESSPRLAVEGTDSPSDIPSVQERNLLAAVEDPQSVIDDGRSPSDDPADGRYNESYR